MAAQLQQVGDTLADIRARLHLPVIAAPLFIVSNPRLVIEQCRAGVIGSFPALNARPKELLQEWLTEISAVTEREPDAAPYAVNLIVHKSNDRLEHDLDVCVRHRAPIVITSLGARTDVNDAVHSYGGVVLHDVITIAHARKAVEKGADGLIAVAAGAGGHAGRLSPFALVQEIREWFDGPLVLSGAIANGRSVLAAEAMGADFAYVGSAFIATEEANAPRDYKQGIVEGRAEDIVYTNYFTGVHGNYLRSSIVRAGLDPEQLPGSDPSKMDFGAKESGAKAWRDIWGSGQGIGAVQAVAHTRTVIDRMKREYDEARRSILMRAACGGETVAP
jgi:nitronate monooxygenase